MQVSGLKGFQVSGVSVQMTEGRRLTTEATRGSVCILRGCAGN